jgi:hypothetical protein
MVLVSRERSSSNKFSLERVDLQGRFFVANLPRGTLATFLGAAGRHSRRGATHRALGANTGGRALNESHLLPQALVVADTLADSVTNFAPERSFVGLLPCLFYAFYFPPSGLKKLGGRYRARAICQAVFSEPIPLWSPFGMARISLEWREFSRTGSYYWSYF